MSSDNFIWTDDRVRAFGEWYRKVQGNCNIETWGKDTLEVFKGIVQKQKPLFKTDDDKEIFDGEPVIIVNKDNFSINVCHYGLSKGYIKKDNLLYFQSIENATQWIDMNKPCLSVNDIKNISCWHSGCNENERRIYPLNHLTELAKQKKIN